MNCRKPLRVKFFAASYVAQAGVAVLSGLVLLATRIPRVTAGRRSEELTPDSAGRFRSTLRLDPGDTARIVIYDAWGDSGNGASITAP